MNRDQYDRRIKKARASRDACFSWYAEAFYQTRIVVLSAWIRRLRKERDQAIAERDAALIALGKIKLGEFKK